MIRREDVVVRPFGERALLIETPPIIHPETHQWISDLNRWIHQQSLPGIIETIPAYASLMLLFEPHKMVHTTLQTIITDYLDKNEVEEWIPAAPTVEIPICYDPEFALDQQILIEHTGLDWPAIIAIHSQHTYKIYQLGFLPGFPFLGELDPRIHCPRKATPALHVPKGSVGIGGQQTGIYSLKSPGGWNIIGRCPIELFRPEHERPFFLEQGMNISFKPIEMSEFLELQNSFHDR
ncbi:MAG: 5-oxoprolinase subunit PxpB [Saprospiraceae bacterium]|nr:5-oxoprolinase subunit PxpB [Saprospiraceae bacterium]